MQRYEYSAVRAPQRAGKSAAFPKGADPLAETFSEKLNEQALLGWEFMRTETVRIRRRHLLVFKSTEEQQLIFFRRQIRRLVEEDPAKGRADPAAALLEDRRRAEERQPLKPAEVRRVRPGRPSPKAITALS